MARSLSPLLYADEARCVDALLKTLPWDQVRAMKVKNRAAEFVQAIRTDKRPAGQLESFLQQYALDTEEGLALMCLAEALLRIPDKETANELIRDKVAAANWLEGLGGSQDWMAKAAGVGMMVTSRTLDSALSRVGQPLIREAMVKAMRLMGGQFVLGQTIDEALKTSEALAKKGYSFSYDMLGEAARSAEDAERYMQAYTKGIHAIGKKVGAGDTGISIKLSALHPRYSYAQRERCVPVLIERLTGLAQVAANYNVPLTVDAEEVDRLEISLDIMEGVLRDKSLAGWEGFGIVVQSYQKRAPAVIDHLTDLVQDLGRCLRVRVVKGAYWDSEIKRAQIQGLPDYPVYTRKVNTDLSFLTCAHKLFERPDRFYPMIGTHNAYTAAAILEMAQGRNFEFQRLHGMGISLHDKILKDGLAKVCIYAPVGPHEDLLAYLVRRLLENGANSSFVNQVLDLSVPVDDLVRDPVEDARNAADKRHPKIALPYDLYAREEPVGRRNSSGVDLADPDTASLFLQDLARHTKSYEAAPLIGGKIYKNGAGEDVGNPSDCNDTPGRVYPGTVELVDIVMKEARDAFPAWSRTPADERASALERFADLLEENREELMALLTREAGKTLPDALSELREATDFARYYAHKGRHDFAESGTALPGPTGESNRLKLVGRGVFVCISPWNFPLAIFTGQILAALMAGNTVVAKPASLTPLIAMKTVQLMHKAGIPASAINLFPGSGRLGAALVAHKDVAGVTFTGSTAVAQDINRTLAAKDGPIVPLIAETGGMNAMIVDSSALPEQVVDDVITSAFSSAGQRCSALRILCLQEDVADKILRMLKGAMAEVKVGLPGVLSSDVGPVIDRNALAELSAHREFLRSNFKQVHEVEVDSALTGSFFGPCAYELPDLSRLDKEVFGPILHVVRFKKSDLGKLVATINGKGFGLTFGLHTRIDEMQKKLAEDIAAGNIYVNRSMIGAVVGTQPFGGMGLSGTGPKAGGPHYMHRFATEKVISINTTAAGGNASLVSLCE